MKRQTETTITTTDVFVLRSTPEGYQSSRLSHPQNSPQHNEAVMERALEMAMASDSAIGMLTLSWRS